MSVTSQFPDAAPARTAGTSPARTTEDLPMPEGPTTATNERSPITSSSSSTRPVLPQKSAASASWNAWRPL